jgi:hypothetical protein
MAENGGFSPQINTLIKRNVAETSEPDSTRRDKFKNVL